MNLNHVMVAACGALVFASSAAQAQTIDTSQTSSSQSTTSYAERGDYFTQPVDAPRQAFELTVGTGYTQGFGMVQSGVSLPDVVGAGLGVDLGAGYRIDPRFAVLATGQYQEFNAQRGTGTRGLAAGLAGAYHFAPYVRSDPWIQLGAGYRMMWETASNTPTLLTHGFELAKLTAGFDVRLSQDIAVMPVVGADLNLFLWQNGGNAVAIADPRLSTFVFAGAQGRFDIGGTRVRGSDREVAAR